MPTRSSHSHRPPLHTSPGALVIQGNIDPATAGLALMYALDLTRFLKHGTNMASKAEADFNSVERMVQVDVGHMLAPPWDSTLPWHPPLLIFTPPPSSVHPSILAKNSFTNPLHDNCRLNTILPLALAISSDTHPLPVSNHFLPTYSTLSLSPRLTLTRHPR